MLLAITALNPFRQYRWVLTTTSLMLLLNGCVQMPQKSSAPNPPKRNAAHFDKIKQISTFDLQGRIGLQTKDKGFSGKLDWQHNADQDTINLFSPFGGQVAQIIKTPLSVTLTDSKGKTIAADNMQMLMKNNLGWTLPITSLEDWALGREKQTGDVAIDQTWDAQGRLLSLKQDGWAIQYKSYKQVSDYDLPSKLTLRKEGLYLKLLINTWDIQ